MATLDIITLEEAKATLNLSEFDEKHNDELARFITSVSGRLDDLCGPVVARAVTELHDGGRDFIRPRITPVLSVTSLREFVSTTATTLTAETNTSKPADAFMLDDVWTHDVTVRRRSNGYDALFALGRRNVELVVSAGRFASTAAVDPKFKMAAALTVQHMWQPSAGSWAQSPDFGETRRSPVAPWMVPRAVTELLGDELLPPGGA